MTKTIHAFISGKVQGVYYRAWTVETATRLGVHGWVRNVSDGRVEAVFSGEDSAVEAMLAACRHGPDAAKVSGVEAKEITEIPPKGFEQRPSV